MKLLLTGNRGFVGTHLTTALAAHQLATMDPKDGSTTADYYHLERGVEKFKPEMIVHVGASCSTRISIEKPRLDFQNNAIGTFNVAEVARTHGNIPVLYTSTVKVQAGEDGLVAPLGLSKWVGEEYLRTFNSLYDLPYVILQPSTIYGPGQHGDRNLGWVSHFVRCAVDGKQPTVYGTGHQSRDVLYIADFVKLMVDIVENFDLYAGDTYPVGGGQDNELSIVQLLNYLGLTQYGRQPAIPTDLDRVVTDNSKITSVNGWQPTTHWRTGIDKTKEAMQR